MAKNLLLEIRLKEMPAHVVTPSIEQLEEKTVKFLDENRLTYGTVETLSTPRRLAIKVTNTPERQADNEEEVKGPAKRIASDADGNWTKAAEEFVRGQGLTTDAITFRELRGVEYVYVTKYIHGREAKEILTGLADVIRSLTFPVTMYWAKYDFEYIRPIHWIVALLDDKIVLFEILDIKTDRASRGHYSLGEDMTSARTREYEEKLDEQSIIASP